MRTVHCRGEIQRSRVTLVTLYWVCIHVPSDCVDLSHLHWYVTSSLPQCTVFIGRLIRFFTLGQRQAKKNPISNVSSAPLKCRRSLFSKPFSRLLRPASYQPIQSLRNFQNLHPGLPPHPPAGEGLLFPFNIWLSLVLKGRIRLYFTCETSLE